MKAKTWSKKLSGERIRGALCDVVEAFRSHVGRACEGMTLPVRQSGSVT